MENLLLWGCWQVQPLIKDDYRVLLALLATSARILWHLQRCRQKSLPAPFWACWPLSWAVRAGVLLLDERILLTPSEELKFEVQGQVLSFLSFYSWEIHVCLYVYIYTYIYMSNVPTYMRGRRRRGREWQLSYLLFLFYFLQQKLLLSPFLAAAVWHYSFCSNNMIVLLANVKLNGCKQWLKDCCTETGDLGHS